MKKKFLCLAVALLSMVSVAAQDSDESVILMKSGEAIVEPGKTYMFYDAGGPDGNYPFDETVLVIRPSVPNGVVKVEFTKFVLDYWDEFNVYNGGSVESPKVGSFNDEGVPSDLAALESTSEDGALTFEFIPDGWDSHAGWEAKVTVSVKVDCDLAMSAFVGDRYVVDGEAGKYNVTVQNKGVLAVAGTDYKVVLKDAKGVVLAEANGVNLEPAASAEIALEATFAGNGEVVATASIECEKDGDVANNSSEMVVNVIAKGSNFVQVGAATEKLSVCPIDFDSHQSVSQTLYYPNEIGVEKGLLKMISYQYHTVKTNFADVPLKVWVAETDKEDLSTNMKADEMTLVFEGSVAVKSVESELIIPLADGYEYNGGTLAVMVEKLSSGTGTVTFKGTYDDSKNRTRYDAPWDEDETISVNDEFGWDVDKILPNTKFLFLETSGVESVAVENVNAPVEYYNLQGVKVANPANGIFIKVQGDKATKEYVK